MPVNPDSKTCVEDELSRWRSGQLHSGSGEIVPVTARGKKQALVISLSAFGKSHFEESLLALGFSEESAKQVSKMLPTVPDWPKQFLTGIQDRKLPRENKITIAPGLPDFDIDNRPGKQKGDQGKQKEQSSLSISPMVVAGGNPQQGPRSRSDRKGLAMF